MDTKGSVRSAPTIGHRAVAVFPGVLLAGTALAAPAVAAGHQAGPPRHPSPRRPSPMRPSPSRAGPVIAKPAVNVRQNPNTSRPPVDSISFGTIIELDCKVNGQARRGEPPIAHGEL